MKRILLVGVLLLALLVLAACAASPPEIDVPDEPEIGVPDESIVDVELQPIDAPPFPLDESVTVVASNTRFAFDLYEQFRQEEGNVFFSPWSISTALAMTMEGARGETLNEMAKTLHLTQGAPVRQEGFRVLHDSLNADNDAYDLSTANALWLEQTAMLRREYVAAVKESYGGSLQLLDFKAAPEESRMAINEWVEDRTNDKIKNLLPEGSVDGLTRLILTNAIYFKGAWELEFDPTQTRDAPFYGDEEVVAELMFQHEEAGFALYEDEEVQVASLPYKGGRLSMLVVLPRAKDALSDVEAALSVERLNGWRAGLVQRSVEVYLPKFTFTYEKRLSSTLQELGMPLAFTERADFGAMNPDGGFYITGVIHKAFVEVNEEGTEAAAATGVIIGTVSIPPPPPVFRADHPFLFFIVDDETGSILFMGRVVDPTA